MSSRNSARHVTLIVEQLRRRVPGGIGTYARELIRAISVADANVTAEISLYASRSPSAPDPLGDLGFALRTSPFPGPVMTRLWDLGLGALTAGAGVVHALSLASPPTNDPLVVTVHDLTFRELPETFTPHGRRWHERAIKRCARRADRFVVPSPAVADQLVDAGLGITRERVRVIAEGADHLGVRDDATTDALLASVGVKGKFIMSVATIEPRKNLARLISAFDAVRTQLDEPYSLIICGPTGWLAELEPTEGVFLVGHVPDAVLASLYSRAEVVAYVPLSEGFGLPVVEAMFHGAVVLSSAVPSASSGTLLVDPYDVSAIASGLARCATDHTLREKLQVAARSYSSQLTWAKTAEAHIALWDEVRRG